MRNKLKAEHEIEEETIEMDTDSEPEQMLIDQDLEYERRMIMRRRQDAAEVTTCTLIIILKVMLICILYIVIVIIHTNGCTFYIQ